VSGVESCRGRKLSRCAKLRAMPCGQQRTVQPIGAGSRTKSAIPIPGGVSEDYIEHVIPCQCGRAAAVVRPRTGSGIGRRLRRPANGRRRGVPVWIRADRGREARLPLAGQRKPHRHPAGQGSGRWAPSAGILGHCKALICRQPGKSPQLVLTESERALPDSDGMIGEAATDVFAGRISRRALQPRDLATSSSGSHTDRGRASSLTLRANRSTNDCTCHTSSHRQRHHR